MNCRDALENPAQAIASRWGDTKRCPHRADIERLSRAWHSLKPDYKALQAEKGALSRAIGEARKAGSDIDELKRKVADISARLKHIDEQRKTLLADAEALFASDREESLLPGCFQPWSGREHAAPLRIETCPETGGEAWDAYVASHPQASLYHRFGWRDVIRASFGHEMHYWQARDGHGRIVGVLPLVRLRSRLFGDFGVSLPYFNYGGALGDNPTVVQALIRHATAWGEREQVAHIEFRHMAPLPKLAARTDKVSMIRALPSTPEQLDVEIGAKVRAQIKQARRYRPETCIGGQELLDDFYRVFAANMRDLGTPVYGKSFFANMLARWENMAKLVVIRTPEPVAAAFLLGEGELLEIPWASTLRSANPMNMNMFLYWEVLSLAIRSGFRYFDFGRSTVDAGTFQFKKQWGARPAQHHWHYWLPKGTELPSLSPNNPKFKLAIALWRRLPLPVTTSLGPHIVKFLP
jgi:serine/alanine adding enzyme